MLAGSILALGLAIALLLPNGYSCGEATEVHRQWSYSQGKFFYGCWPKHEPDRRGIPFRPFDAGTDWRIPIRAGALLGGFLLALTVLANDGRRQRPGSGTTSGTGFVVGLYGLGSAVIAILLTLQEDSYCIRFGRGPGSLTCSYRSFFGCDAEPIVVEGLFALIGAGIGVGAGLLVARWARRSERRTAAVHDASRPA